MKIITGKEETTQGPKLNAIHAFYTACRLRRLSGVADVWARSEQVLMANPLGGIKIGAYYEFRIL